MSAQIHSSRSATPRRSIYLLPNLFTTAALFAGFFAIIAGFHERFDAAVIAVYIAMIMDTLDGRIARLTKTQSAFGAQYDSLSDMVAFALAPALVTYVWAFQGLGRIGWAVSFFYLACTVLRLARFNIQVNRADPRYFIGLPCPAAAAVVMGMIWVVQNNGLDVDRLYWLVIIVMSTVAALMVSNIRYYSFKKFDLKGRIPFLSLLIMVLLFIIVTLDPFDVLFILFSGYALYGPIWALWRWVAKRRGKKQP